MLAELPAFIPAALRTNQDLIAANPNVVGQINAKIAVLQKPTLSADIARLKLYFEGSATSSNGRVISIVAVFPADSMRAAATTSVRALESALPRLEQFMQTPFPIDRVRVWYGFTMGNTGGGGTINMEDQGTYESRTNPSTRLPFSSILYHELAHSYVGSEALTQFLEAYLFNVLRSGSTEVSQWSGPRPYTPFSDANTNFAAVMDVYQLIGQPSMSSAYKAVYPLRPPYGSPLSAAARQVFVDNAPQAAKAQVAAKLGTVTF